MDIIKALAAAIDAKDPYTVGHSHRVSTYAVAVARRLGLSPEMIQHVRIGGLLHDIGKIGIPDAILLKPGRLTQEEYNWMKKHPEVGENIMKQVRLLHNALPCLGEHHEKMDGTGYPRGLKGDQISILGRIVAVADVFDAITSDRPYRIGLSVEDGLDLLCEGVGTQFDGNCVEAFIDLVQNKKITLLP
jgi:putative nucleotidyltransferase with HDIG domain